MRVVDSIVVVASIALALASSAGGALAESYPDRAVRVIVPFPAGQGTDVATRYLMDRLGRALGRSFYVENKPGAGASLGVEMLARSTPDGYTIGIATSGTQTMNPTLYRTVGYDPDRDFAPITLTGRLPLVVAAVPSFPANTIPELVAAARATPDKLNVAVPAPPQRIVLELLRQRADAPLYPVPYKGSASALADVLGGRVPLVIDSITAIRPYIDSHQLKPLGVTSLHSSDLLPGVKSLAEQGQPALELTAWNGLFAPKGTPASVIDLLNAKMREILADPATRKHLLALGFEAVGSTPAELADRVRTDRAKWDPIIRAAHIGVD